jgi:hypothetical protein
MEWSICAQKMRMSAPTTKGSQRRFFKGWFLRGEMAREE